MREYRAVYSESAAGFILTLPKRRQRKLVDTCTRLARHPFITSDYVGRTPADARSSI